MIVGLQIGKETSTGRPGKNYMKILGRNLNEYSLMAAFYCKYIESIYISTDSPSIKNSASKFNAIVIDRPFELATPDSLTEDVLTHSYNFILRDLNEIPEMIVLLFANSPTVNIDKLNEGIKIMKNDPSLDSCFSVVKYNMFSPSRAKRLNNNIIEPFVELNLEGSDSSLRDSLGDVYYSDFSIQILRSSCFENLNKGQPPVKWMGKKTYGLEVDYGFDIDEDWQVPTIKQWLREHGFSTKSTPYNL